MDDLISRQDAIDAFDMPLFNITGRQNAERVVEYLQTVIQRIKELPSAQSEPIKLWLDHELSKEEYERLKKDCAEQPIILLPKESAQQWIPCERELPEVGQDVLFSVQDLFVSEGCLRDDGDWSQFRWQAIQKKEAVTAWMPLPEPWRGEEHETD